MYTIYQFIFPNGKQYIGLTSRPVNERWQNGKGYKSQVVGKAINKYGWNNIEKKILNITEELEEACDLEQYYIQQYNSLIENNGYNVSAGGMGNTIFINKNLVLQYWQQGYELEEIAEKLETSIQLIRRTMNELGVTSKERKERKELNNSTLVSVFDSYGVLRDICINYSEAAKLYGFSSSVIRTSCQNNSITRCGLRFRNYHYWEKQLEELPEAEKKLKRIKRHLKENGKIKW